MLVYQIYLKDKKLRERREQREKNQEKKNGDNTFYFHEIYVCIDKKKLSISESISSTLSEASTIVVHKY